MPKALDFAEKIEIVLIFRSSYQKTITKFNFATTLQLIVGKDMSSFFRLVCVVKIGLMPTPEASARVNQLGRNHRSG